MTRGSEYAALGLARGLRGIQPEEGKALFLPLFEQDARAANTVLLTEGEQRFYGLAMAPPLTDEPAKRRPAAREPRASVPGRGACEWLLDTAMAPYLNHHLVNSTPTLPGSFEIEFAMRAARGRTGSSFPSTGLSFTVSCAYRPTACCS